MMAHRGGRAGGDEGNITLLALGFAVFALLLILTGASATALHVERTRLARLADEAALDAADALNLADYYAGDAPVPTDDAAIELSLARMRRAVDDHVAQNAARQGLDGVVVVSVETPDGHTAVVTLGIVSRPLFGVEALLPWANGVSITATSSARAY